MRLERDCKHNSMRIDYHLEDNNYHCRLSEVAGMSTGEKEAMAKRMQGANPRYLVSRDRDAVFDTLGRNGAIESCSARHVIAD